MNDTTRRGALAAGLAALGTGIVAGPAAARRTAYRPPTLASVRRRLGDIYGGLRVGRVGEAVEVTELRADVARLTDTVRMLVEVLDERPVR